MIYNNPSYLCFKDRKPNIEILHNTYKMYKYTKSLRDTLPSIGMILVRKKLRREEKDIMNLFQLIRNQ